MTDRKSAPPYKTITKHHVARAERLEMPNGIPLYRVNIGEQEAIRIECLFPAASWTSPDPRVSFFTVKMLLEGTVLKNSAEISQILDLYGAFTETVHTPDYYGLTVYTMPKFLPEVLPIVAEVLEMAAFPENEWEKLRNIVLQQLKVNQEQSSWLAGSRFKSALFGENSRYGYAQNEADIRALVLEQIRLFYARHIRSAPFYVFASGKVEERATALIHRYLGEKKIDRRPSGLTNDVTPHDLPLSRKQIKVDKADSSQYTLRLGKKAPGRQHPDYFTALVANEVLGGYFGSRLMKNIREEKGLTYGISSYLPALRDAAYFMIGTDVNKDALPQLLDEIRKELFLLQSEAVPATELERVKNVMAGEFARSLGTAFEIGDLDQTRIICGLPDNFYETYLDNIRAVGADDLLRVATGLFDIETMTEVIVG